ncbi:hypothetical protein PHLGIDRAFT_105851 [Phlebiopsis gigantea 11061_1 CR5-6]|uniref:Uncharacterized protein n=1 Tax=Phlebiopsis gigantea (strain 11061_1 CR5-6) TaxID=745531 RepID=A0A0C3NQ33_PHLG1|nr:hypothetical protein PHLGIDRAFT_105851 [Phlebiopsis gigantea 11061_1 CR5-6]
MPPRSETHTKKPSGGRPLPRRLFSFDSLRKERSNSSVDDSDTDSIHNPFRARKTEKTIQEHPEDPFVDRQWTEKQLVTSPEAKDEPESTFRQDLGSRTVPTPLDLSRPDSIASNGAPPPSPSKRRWETVRYHVLPSSTRVASPPPLTSVDSASTLDRPSTPRLRFGQKKQFRHVVETAQYQVQTENKRLSDALWRICWGIHGVEIHHRSRPEREPTLATIASNGLGSVGSSLHLPFLASTSSLPSAGGSSLASFQGTPKSHGLRRPQSTQSLATLAGTSASMTSLGAALASALSVGNRTRHLPHESLVISALLAPFLSRNTSPQLEAEQGTSAEMFEMILRSWQPSSNEAELERIIWCCKAASISSSSRLRIIGVMSSILFSRDRTFIADSPVVLQTLVRSLLSLQYTLSTTSSTPAEARSVSSYIAEVRAGKCGELTRSSVEKEFGARFSDSDSEAAVREAIIMESVVSCIEVGPIRARRWALRILPEFWPTPEPNSTFTPLLACAHWRKLKRFIGAILALLSEPLDDAHANGELLINLLRTRILSEIECMRDEDSTEIRTKTIQLVLEVLSIGDGTEREYLIMRLCNWYQSEKRWRESIEAALDEMIRQSEWPAVARVIPSLIYVLPKDLQIPFLSSILPSMHKRLINDPLESPQPRLSEFLDFVSRQYPKVFYKPLFVCATASKDATVVNQLCILNALSKLVPDIFTRDPDMMAIALVNDTTTMSMSAATSSDGARAWGTPRIGQVALLVELVDRFQHAHDAKDLAMVSTSRHRMNCRSHYAYQTSAYVKFATTLEHRLGIAIEAKEKITNIPLSHRLFFSALFREIRLLIRSLKPSTWLSSILSWTLQLQEFADDDSAQREVVATMRRLEMVYLQAEEGSQRSHKRRPTAFSPLSPETRAGENQGVKNISQDQFSSKRKLVSAMSKSLKLTALDLLVAVSGLLETEHYPRLGPMLWNECLLDPLGTTAAAACFLFMQFAEKRSEECTQLIEGEMTSSDAVTRRLALERILVLSTWRFQLLSQEVILDRNHRRPFKSQRPPILFVATDIGSSLFVYEDDTEEYRDINGHVIPLELRRRLSEIGWAQEDRLVDPRIQRIKTPMSLLPSLQLDRLDDGPAELPAVSDMQVRTPEHSPKSSPAGSPLTRRESSSSLRLGSKRRPVFVPTLASLFPHISAMTFDDDFTVASLARDLLMDFMRDDPSLIARSVFQVISGDDNDVTTAISTLRAFLHIRPSLPPAMAHHIMNHLTGYLKAYVKQVGAADPLRAFAYCMPLIAKLVTQVSKLSIREIRRAKVDHFMLPSGSLWFPPNAPTGPLFPRYLVGDKAPFTTIPPNLVWITMIRTSQNMLFLSMLKRNPQDVKVIRKNMSHFELPTLQTGLVSSTLTLNDAIPRHAITECTPRRSIRTTLTALSLTLSRSYLLLIEQMFQCMSRHLSDREELALLIDGLIRILLAHGDDIGIVAHVMLALMTAATRFKRIFIAGGGYTLFMPAVIKTYVEAEYNPNIKHAIAYAVNRFYALHQESFIFQTFDIVGQVLTLPEVDGPWVAGGIFALFSALSSGITPGIPDAAGIHELNRAQEQEAMMISMAEEVPQTFLASIKRSTARDEKAQIALTVPDEYEGKRLKLDDLVRLFLTVIAHNPASPRAEYFLRSLRLLAPHLRKASRAAEQVLRGGIQALGSILMNKILSRPKETTQPKAADELKYEALADSTPSRQGDPQNAAPNDFSLMRLEYLLLVTAYTGAGGHLGNPMAITLRVLEIVKMVLKDSKGNVENISIFLAEFVETMLVRDSHQPTVKEATAVVEAFVPLISTHNASVDFSKLYDVLAKLMDNPMLACDPAFSKLIVSQYCRIGLDACDAAASEDFLFSFPLRDALVKLLTNAVTTAGPDVMTELEKQPFSHNFLAGVILPMALTLKTSSDIIEQGQWSDKWRRDAFSKVWLRILALVLAVLKGDQAVESASSVAERRKSTDRSSTNGSFASVKAFSVAVQVLKIIVVRAQDDISEAFPAVWTHISSVLKAVLADGDAMFAFSLRDVSEPPSPAFSPRASHAFEQQQSLPIFSSSVSMHSQKPLSPPRMIDYVTWSLIQWLWLKRSPLMIHMRIFVQERVANLGLELRAQGIQSIGAVSGAIKSKRISTVFSKPRRSMLGGYSPSSSAASTPRTSTIGLPSSSLNVDVRQAGFARQPSPVSPSGRTSRDFNGTKIVHLGPINPYSPAGAMGAPRPSLDVRPSGGPSSLRTLVKEMVVQSPGLVRMTYRRIRLVQQLMGYSDLLPLGGSEFYAEDEFSSETRVWSQRDAVEAVVHETRELLDEFRDSFGDVGDESMVMVDSQLTLATE